MIESKELNMTAPQGREVPGSISKTWFGAHTTVASDVINIMQGSRWSYSMCSVKHQLRDQ